jgi:exosortase
MLTAGLFLLVAGYVYAPVIAKLIDDWWSNEDYSHGLVCVPLAVGMLAFRRDHYARLPRRPRWIGLAGAALASMLLVAGTLGAELFLTRISLVLFVVSATVLLAGWAHVRASAFPLALILLSIPIPAIVLTRLTLPLQFAATSMASGALEAMHVPVLREGNVLVLPDAVLQVAEACSGIRSLVSLLVVGLVVARVTGHFWARLAILASAVPVAIVVNGARVTATAAAAYWYGQAAADSLVHNTFGLLAFALALLLLIGCAYAIAAAERLIPARGLT